jgi:hypothetical protein
VRSLTLRFLREFKGLGFRKGVAYALIFGYFGFAMAGVVLSAPMAMCMFLFIGHSEVADSLTMLP